MQALRSFRWPALAGIFALILINFGLSFARFYVSFNILRLHVPLRLCARAFLFGHLGNQFVFSLIGQALGRSAILAEGGVPASAATFLSFFERVLALLSVLAFAAVGAAVTLGGISIDFTAGGNSLAFLLSSIPLGLFFLFLIRRHVLRMAQLSTRRVSALAIGVTFGLAVLAHIAMLGAFTAALLAIYPEAPLGKAIGALTIVMLLAALPISFSGWGIRELSAIYALGTIGIPSEAATAVGIVVGALSFVLVIGSAAAIVLLPRRQKSDPVGVTAVDASALGNFNRIFAIGVSLAVAYLVYFQARIPMPTHALNVNMADIFALGAISVVIVQWRDFTILGRRMHWLTGPLAIVACIICGAMLVGYLRFGSSSWAVTNRGLGWLVIISYCAIGVLLARYAGRAGIIAVLSATLTAIVMISVLEIIVFYIAPFLPIIPPEIAGPFLEGYASDRNAFALQVAVGLVIWGYLLTISVTDRSTIQSSTLASACVPAILIAALLMTQSRTGFVLLVLLVAGAFLLFPRARRGLVLAAPLAGLISYGPELLFTVLLPELANIWAMPRIDGEASVLGIRLISPNSDLDRWITMQRGLQLWRDAPLFGAGLGGFIEDRIQNGRPAQVIHSVPIWLLAESGIAGLTAMVVAMGVFVRGLWRNRIDTINRKTADAALLLLATFAAGSLVHDFFYQRIVWFILGLFAAIVAARPKVPAADNTA